MKESEVIIIGAGLTGLLLAYRLQDSGRTITILEASERLGGRILTENYGNGTTLELGATWLGRKHGHLNSLLSELGINIFEQVLGSTAFYEPISTSPPQIVSLPPNSDPSYRIQHGSYSLIDKLASKLKDQIQLQLNHKVTHIKKTEDNLIVNTNSGQHTTKMVISTIPPNLLASSVQFSPSLPKEVIRIMRHTHTWMGDSIKIGLTYEDPFWRKGNWSGTIVSNVGPVTELYDHSNSKGNQYSLKGFLNSAYHGLTREERLEVIMTQLQKYYGDIVRSHIGYHEKIWRQEPLTFEPYDHSILPHQNNGHSVYRKALLNDSLYIGGSETAIDHPGYMEGAVSSATEIANKIISIWQQ